MPATAQGRSTGPRRRAAHGYVGARRGSLKQRRMRLHRGRSVGSRWGAACGCAGKPGGAGLEGGSLAHRRSSGSWDRSGCCGCALPGAHGGDPPVCPRAARQGARRGAARIRGACTAQLVRPWRAGPQRGGLVPPLPRSCASTAEVLCLHRRGLVPPQRRSCASTVESDCCSISAALLCCSHWLQ